jgi:hypothetical protein
MRNGHAHDLDNVGRIDAVVFTIFSMSLGKRCVLPNRRRGLHVVPLQSLDIGRGTMTHLRNDDAIPALNKPLRLRRSSRDAPVIPRSRVGLKPGMPS